MLVEYLQSREIKSRKLYVGWSEEWINEFETKKTKKDLFDGSRSIGPSQALSFFPQESQCVN